MHYEYFYYWSTLSLEYLNTCSIISVFITHESNCIKYKSPKYTSVYQMTLSTKVFRCFTEVILHWPKSRCPLKCSSICHLKYTRIKYECYHQQKCTYSNKTAAFIGLLYYFVILMRSCVNSVEVVSLNC